MKTILYSKNNENGLLLLFILALSILNGAAQTRVLTGTVTSSGDGLPIPGVSVAVKGTSLGTSTNVVGVYSLNLPVNSKVLVFSFVGMKAKEVPVPVSDRLDVVLSPDMVNMDEVVVTAMGISREKKSLTYSATEVKSDDLARSNEANVVTSLSGKVAGVQISSSSGLAGGSSRITIRGVSS